jgi:hypothetical protein
LRTVPTISATANDRLGTPSERQQEQIRDHRGIEPSRQQRPTPPPLNAPQRLDALLAKKQLFQNSIRSNGIQRFRMSMSGR